MSRSDNTMPVRLQVEDGKQFMHSVGGSFRGIGEATRLVRRRRRRKVKADLAGGRQPSPEQERHSEKHHHW